MELQGTTRTCAARARLVHGAQALRAAQRGERAGRRGEYSSVPVVQRDAQRGGDVSARQRVPPDVRPVRLRLGRLLTLQGTPGRPVRGALDLLLRDTGVRRLPFAMCWSPSSSELLK